MIGKIHGLLSFFWCFVWTIWLRKCRGCWFILYLYLYLVWTSRVRNPQLISSDQFLLFDSIFINSRGCPSWNAWEHLGFCQSTNYIVKHKYDVLRERNQVSVCIFPIWHICRVFGQIPSRWPLCLQIFGPCWKSQLHHPTWPASINRVVLCVSQKKFDH